jgi:pimeloyl-ACP methyl ester carboxylesterase
MNTNHLPAYHLAYSVFGSGPKILFLFHGFGQDKKIFAPWAETLGEAYTLYAVDLFYHGESQREERPLNKAEWTAIFGDFLTTHGIDRFSVAGFSLGGRFAIATAIAFPDRIDSLTLIAPDAVYKTPWFRMATSWELRWLFKYYMTRPGRLERLIRNARSIRVISKYMADFVQKELGTQANRRRVYISWNHFKPLGYTGRQLCRQFASAPFTRHIILGTKDIVIPPSKILPILRGSGFRVTLLDLKHHQLVKGEVAEKLL